MIPLILPRTRKVGKADIDLFSKYLSSIFQMAGTCRREFALFYSQERGGGQEKLNHAPLFIKLENDKARLELPPAQSSFHGESCSIHPENALSGHCLYLPLANENVNSTRHRTGLPRPCPAQS